jgi:hypothetical protein
LPLPTQFPAFGGQGKSRRPTAATQRTAIFGGERKSGKLERRKISLFVQQGDGRPDQKNGKIADRQFILETIGTRWL